MTASLLREGTYSTIRLGAYEPVKELFGASHHTSPFWKKLAAGATTGAVGSAIATPTDLVRVRMQGQKPGYFLNQIVFGMKPRIFFKADAFF